MSWVVQVLVWGGGTACGELGYLDRGVGVSGMDGYSLRLFGVVNRGTNSVLGVLGCMGEANISKKY